MKPFHKRSSPLTAPQKAAKSADVIANSNSAETAAPTAIVQEKFPAISMSADLKSMLDQPLDPRVDRILQKINDGKIADERSAKGPRAFHSRVTTLPCLSLLENNREKR